MYRGIVAILICSCVSAGCSAYDVAAISADVALELLTGVNEGRSSKDNNPHNDPIRFWNYETSSCIRATTRKNDLEQELDAAFDAIEAHQDFVLLPTGEKYAIAAPPAHDEPPISPTAKCLARDSG